MEALGQPLPPCRGPAATAQRSGIRNIGFGVVGTPRCRCSDAVVSMRCFVVPVFLDYHEFCCVVSFSLLLLQLSVLLRVLECLLLFRSVSFSVF